MVVRTFNVQDGIMSLDKVFFTDEETFNQRVSRARPEAGDLIITREAPMGEVCVIPKGVDCCLGQRLVLVKPDLEKVDIQFLLYSLLSEFSQTQIGKNKNTGSIVSNLRIPLLKDLLIPDIEIDAQRAIGNVLSVIDKKIVLNKLINTELESMAKLIYDYWFVQFDFPDENGKPYKSSNGKMIYNKELKKKIPQGWEVNNLKNNCLTKIITPNIGDFDGKKIYLATDDIQGNNINFRAEEVSFRQRPTRANMQPVENSIWFAKMKNTKKVLYIGDYSEEFLNHFILSTGFAGLECREDALGYIWGFINNNRFECTKDRVANGSTQEALNNDSMVFIRLLIPTDTVLEKYQRTVKNIYAKIYNNQIENKELTNLRGWLLPMLMNGQVKIN